MKRSIFFLLSLSIVFISCKKDKADVEVPKTYDYRDSIIGEYAGYRVYTDYNANPTQGQFDTVPVATVTLTKSLTDDSIIEATFTPNYMNVDVSFKYENNEFIPTTGYHPPIMSLSNDSLYYKHRFAQAPIWFEYFVVKVP